MPWVPAGGGGIHMLPYFWGRKNKNREMMEIMTNM
jgi:hypothetical protein